MNITAVIVTRGDVALDEQKARLQDHFPVRPWNNGTAVTEMQLFGAYLAAADCDTDLIFNQDDDVAVLDPLAIVRAWEPGKIVCNMPAEFQAAYCNRKDKLMGFGSVYERALIRPTFARYLKYFGIDTVTLREAHRIFTALNADRIKMVDAPKIDMPWASDSNRLWKQPDHAAMHLAALRRVEYILEKEKAEQ